LERVKRERDEARAAVEQEKAAYDDLAEESTARFELICKLEVERDEARAEAEQLHQVIQALTDAMHRVMPHDKVAQLLRDAQG